MLNTLLLLLNGVCRLARCKSLPKDTEFSVWQQSLSYYVLKNPFIILTMAFIALVFIKIKLWFDSVENINQNEIQINSTIDSTVKHRANPTKLTNLAKQAAVLHSYENEMFAVCSVFTKYGGNQSFLPSRRIAVQRDWICNNTSWRRDKWKMAFRKSKTTTNLKKEQAYQHICVHRLPNEWVSCISVDGQQQQQQKQKKRM